MAETDFVGQLDEIYGRVHEALDSSLAMICSLHKAEEERHREIRKEIASLQQEIADVITSLYTGHEPWQIPYHEEGSDLGVGNTND